MAAIRIFDNEPDPLVLEPGEAVFAPGDDGGTLFAVIEGEVELTVDGSVVEVAGPGAIFGEVALVDSGPRSGGARARSAARLAVVDRDRFVQVVQTHPTFALRVMETRAEVLGAVSLLSTLDEAALAGLAAAAEERSWAPGERIVAVGEPGDRVYVLLAGSATARPAQGTPVVLHPGDHFGDIAVLHGVPRTADVVAEVASRTLSVAGDALLAALRGPIARS